VETEGLAGRGRPFVEACIEDRGLVQDDSGRLKVEGGVLTLTAWWTKPGLAPSGVTVEKAEMTGDSGGRGERHMARLSPPDSPLVQIVAWKSVLFARMKVFRVGKKTSGRSR
jgi:hypothetical protein